MRLYPVKTPYILERLFPHYTWKRSSSNNSIYLTFDDGPTDELNPFIISTLKEYEVKANFFCVGENLRKNRGEAMKLIDQGHRLGNHTQKHLNGWKTGMKTYLDSIDLCQENLEQLGVTVKLFRPPYGRITKKQGQAVLKQGYEIIMWDVLSGDFDQNLSKEKCLKNSMKYIGPGSIIVFHDNVKAESNLKYVLPRFLEQMLSEGNNFELL